MSQSPLLNAITLPDMDPVPTHWRRAQKAPAEERHAATEQRQ
jgi:hypothetical protein